MALGIRRRPDESWRDCVARVAGKEGLKEECLAHFDADVATGTEPSQAAWNALYEWDCLSFMVD